jgi:uncharacterized protein
LTLYLDTSLLVASVTRESKTASVQRWLREQEPETLAVSDWAITEFSAALSLKVRTQQITAEDRADALALFVRSVEESFALLPVSGMQFRTAARFADQYELGLRAGDALHLAVCTAHGATLCTLDHRLGKVAPGLGVKTFLL